MIYRRFLDFTDDSGESVIREWLRGIADVQARSDIQELIRRLEVEKRPSLNDLKKLTQGDCKGIWELRIKCNGVQYRPLGYFGPWKNQFTILVGATERDRKLVPRDACATARKRMRLVEQYREGRVCEHRQDV